MALGDAKAYSLLAPDWHEGDPVSDYERGIFPAGSQPTSLVEH